MIAQSKLGLSPLLNRTDLMSFWELVQPIRNAGKKYGPTMILDTFLVSCWYTNSDKEMSSQQFNVNVLSGSVGC